MKTIKQIIIILITLLIALIIGSKFYLQHGLNKTVQDKLPLIKEAINADISLEDISLNIFAGSLDIKNFKIGNPPGFNKPELFSIKESRQNIGLFKLITQMTVNIEEISAKNALINIIRNEKNEINIFKFLSQLRREDKSENLRTPTDKNEVGEEGYKEKPTKKDFQLPKTLLDKLLITSKIKFIDHTTKQPLNLDFDIIIKGNNIKNFGTEQDQGDFNITGNLSQNKELFVTNVKGNVSPITNSSKPTFNLTGTINTIDLKLFEEFLKETKLIEGMVDLSIKVDCIKGVFNTTKSTLNIHMKKLIFEEDTFPEEMETPKTLDVIIPIEGTLEEPRIEMFIAIQRALIKLINPEEMIKNLIKKELSEKEKKIEKELGKFFGDDKKAKEVTQSLQNLFK